MKDRKRTAWSSEVCYWALVAVVSLAAVGMGMVIADLTGHRGF